jgi:hypothetical protein
VTQESPAQAPEHETNELSFWRSFSQADIRLLVVTTAGTVIGAVLTVAIVAVAIITAKLFAGSGGLAGTGAFIGSMLGGLLAVAILMGQTLRFVPPDWRIVVRSLRLLMYGLAGIFLMFFLFGLLGYAAGIK